MKRFHVNVRVKDIPQSIAFYSAVFNAPPTVHKDDYAKWMLEDPRVNFAISLHPEKPGIEHLGIQAESPEELQQVYQHLKRAKASIQEEGACSCCYAKSEKAWVADPQGVNWEAFYTYGDATVYGEGIHSRENRVFFRKAASDYEKARAFQLLEQNKLSVTDLAPEAEFYLLTHKGKLLGTGAIEVYGQAALLRSICTDNAARGTGYGKLITEELERIAAAKGLAEAWLLTTTAADFFARQGYSVAAKADLPAALAAARQVSETCPASATIMRKRI